MCSFRQFPECVGDLMDMVSERESKADKRPRLAEKTDTSFVCPVKRALLAPVCVRQIIVSHRC